MNPLSHSQIGQATHQEYEAKYGNHYSGDELQPVMEDPISRQKVVLAFGGLTAIALMVFLFLQF